MKTQHYCGRFAPSPTGPLHFGSLVAALGSCLDARAAGGRWLLRIEDIDLTRCPSQNAYEIIRVLSAFGFEWDGEPLWQSCRSDAYRAAFDKLLAADAVFPCACSRREVADSVTTSASAAAPQFVSAADGAPVYPGTCRKGLPAGRTARSWRLRVGDAFVGFSDRLQGRVEQHIGREVGDFVLLRADGYFAYQLAVVVDDAEQGITDVVRGADLLDSTARQILLQQHLAVPQPRYAHLPIAVTRTGEKLSKQTGANALEIAQAVPTLFAALEFLGQSPAPELARASVGAVWKWARENWRIDAVARVRALQAPGESSSQESAVGGRR